MNAPKVSVIIPAYNRERLIGRAIQSVLSQTMPDWEMIIVDDGSTDDTAEAAKRVGDARITVLRQANAGPSAARNTGMKRARGEYIALLDSDDAYAPTFLERATRFLDARPECAIAATNAVSVSCSGKESVTYAPGAIIGTEEMEGVVGDTLRTRIRHRSFPQIFFVLRSALLPELGGFDPDIHAGEEEELLLRWLPKGQVGYIAAPLVYRYHTPGSYIRDLRRTTHAKAVLWEKVIPRDQHLQQCLPSYRRFRDFRMFRAAVISVAAGCLDDAKAIARLWPPSPLSWHWWVGRTLVSLPKPILRLLHLCVGWTDAVKNRNAPPE